LSPKALRNDTGERCNTDEGYEAGSVLCARCQNPSHPTLDKPRYILAKTGFACQKCPKPATNQALLGMTIVLSIIGLSGLVAMTVMSGGRKKEVYSEAMKKIILNHMQVISLAAAYPFMWPKIMEAFFDSTSSLSAAGEQIMSISCEMSPDAFGGMPVFFQQSAVMVIMPVIMFIGTALFWGLKYMLENRKSKFKKRQKSTSQSRKKVSPAPIESGKSQDSTKKIGSIQEPEFAPSIPSGDNDGYSDSNQQSGSHKWMRGSSRHRLMMIARSRVPIPIWSKFVASLIVLVFMVFPPLCKTCFQMIACTTIGKGSAKLRFLAGDISIRCFHAEHVKYIMMFGIPMVTYVLLIPISCIMALKLNADHLHTRENKLKYMMLLAGFKRRRYWWEGVIMIRKALIVFVSVFFESYGVGMQSFVGILVVFIFMSLHVHVRPYKEIPWPPPKTDQDPIWRIPIDTTKTPKRVQMRKQFKNDDGSEEGDFTCVPCAKNEKGVWLYYYIDPVHSKPIYSHSRWVDSINTMETAAMFVQTMTLYLGQLFLQHELENLHMLVTCIIVFLNVSFLGYNVPIFVKQFYVDKLESKLENAMHKIEEGEKKLVHRASSMMSQTHIISEDTENTIDNNVDALIEGNATAADVTREIGEALKEETAEYLGTWGASGGEKIVAGETRVK